MNIHSRKIWICNDLWMDIFPFFDRPQLGLQMALISPRFDSLVAKHFDGKRELTIWRPIEISKDIGLIGRAKLSVQIGDKLLGFPLPDSPLPTKIRFTDLWITYIDYSVITFLRSKRHIWDRSGIKLDLSVWSYKIGDHHPPIWDVLARQIWPIFAPSIRHLIFKADYHLVNLRRLISPTILTDLDQLHSIDADFLLSDGIADDGPNATVGQALSKWLHTPRKDGQPKQLRCCAFLDPQNTEWVNNFKKTFLCATASASYTVHFNFPVSRTSIVAPFECLVNERTNEKLTLMKEGGGGGGADFGRTCWWMMQRCCPIVGQTTATVQWENDGGGNWDDKLNNVKFNLWAAKSCIGPLLSTAEEASWSKRRKRRMSERK